MLRSSAVCPKGHREEQGDAAYSGGCLTDSRAPSWGLIWRLGRGLLNAVPSHSCTPRVSMGKLAPAGFSSETLRPGEENLSRRSEHVTSPRFYSLDN